MGLELNIDRGLKSYEVKDADGAVLGTVRFNPADLGMAARWKEVEQRVAQMAAGLAGAVTPDDLVRLDRELREAFDYAFGTPVSQVFFAGVSPLAVCEDDGGLLVEKIMAALTPVLRESQEQAAQKLQARMESHTAPYSGRAAQAGHAAP